MSWSFEAQGGSKELVKAGVMNDPSVTEWKYCPVEVAEGICKMIDCLAEPDRVTVLSVFTNGHVTTPGGNGSDSISVRICYRPK